MADNAPRNPRKRREDKPTVRPSIPAWKRMAFSAMPIRRHEVKRFMERIGTERDLRILCTFGVPCPLPVNGCRHPVLLDGQVYDADALRGLYVDPFCPDANPHHARTLIGDALLLRANRTPVTDRNLRDMAPMLAQAAPEPFELVEGDPAHVVVRVARELEASGLMQPVRRQQRMLPMHALTEAGRVRLEEHVRGKWRAAVN